jgi:hypothetical protein
MELRKIIFRVLNFCRDNAPIIISLASLSIAWNSLNLTITAQREEREHKEFLLRPNLNLNVEVQDYSVTVVNRGLGPALITDTLYYLDGRCGTLNRDNVERADIVNIVRGLGRFFHPQFSELMWDEYKSTQGFLIRVPLPNEIISVGQEVALFKLEHDLVEEVNSKLHAFPGGKRASFNDAFARLSMVVPVAVRYCSLSEKYCHAPTSQNIPCQF